MALHSMIGFGMAALGGTVVGLAIDAAGGPASDAGWTAAFLVMGLAAERPVTVDDRSMIATSFSLRSSKSLILPPGRRRA